MRNVQTFWRIGVTVVALLVAGCIVEQQRKINRLEHEVEALADLAEQQDVLNRKTMEYVKHQTKINEVVLNTIK